MPAIKAARKKPVKKAGKGRGRPKLNTIDTTFRMDADKWEEFKKASERKGFSSGQECLRFLAIAWLEKNK